MASKTVLVLLYRERTSGAGTPHADGHGAPSGDARDDSGEKGRKRGVASAVRAAGGEPVSDQDGGKRIAIVDDDLDLLTTYSFVLEHLGYSTLTANDGDEIVDQVLGGREVSPDVILMDYRMPKKNGLDAAKIILRSKPRIKIIISTADDSIKEAAIDAGMVFLQKPFSMDDLSAAIREALTQGPASPG